MDHGNNQLFECCAAILKFSSIDATGVYENIMFSVYVCLFLTITAL